ncbi:MAG: beta-lactamase family protein [Clostridia bacterium]|nr:beta-lactamase family protein [Clostridia bacterium]
MTLDDAVRFFVDEARSLSCMRITVGNAVQTRSAARCAPADRIFDLASLTKAFTGFTAYRLMEEGRLDFAAPVTRYAPQFIHLESVSVSQVLGFEVSLQSPGRVDAAPDRDEALRRLFAVSPRANGDRPYSDMHAMVLKYIIEGASGESWLDTVRALFLKPMGLREIWVKVPENERSRCVSCDREHRIERGEYILREGIAPGTPHDPKARALNLDGDDCPGHAGLFGTAGAVARFAQGVLRGEAVSQASLRDMARRRTGFVRADGSCQQYLGGMCYIRHPIQYFSEVPPFMTGAAVAWSGFTGHHLSIDPALGVFNLALGSRVENRLTVLLPREGETLADYGLNADGTGTVRWPDGTEIRSSVHYVHLRDAWLHQAAADTLQSINI